MKKLVKKFDAVELFRGRKIVGFRDEMGDYLDTVLAELSCNYEAFRDPVMAECIEKCVVV